MADISIITTVFNSVKTIKNCLESVHRQTCPVEHIIIDGGSTDGTLEIIDEYKSNISKIKSEPDEGMYDGLNKGIKFATGNVIGILHADDLFNSENIIEKVIAIFKNESVDSCYGDILYVATDDTNRIVRYWKAGKYDIREFYWGWMPPHPTFFVRRKIYEKYGGFNLELGTAADYELILRFLVKYKISVSYLPEIVTRMRLGGLSNKSIKNRLLANINDRKAWQINHMKPYPWTLYLKPFRKIFQYLQRPKIK